MLFLAPDPWPPLNARIQAALRRLTPDDLALSKAGLARRVDAIGKGSGLFSLFNGSGPLTKVLGAPAEWTVVIEARRDEMVPCAGYWLGARGRRVAVATLPDSPESLEGPLVGEWRRLGPYLLAAGYSRAFHSPAFADGVFLVFAEGREGIRLLQKGKDEFVRTSIAFRSGRDDIISRAEDLGFLTLRGFRPTALRRETVWRFRKGRYRVLSRRIVHDRIWAVDRLATAVRLDRSEELRAWIPDRAARARLVASIRRALGWGERRIFMEDDGTLSLRLGAGDESSVRVRLVVRHGRWIVAR